MADGRDRQACCEKFRYQFLQILAFQIFTHAARPMPAREKKAIEIFAPDLPPRERRLEGGILRHRGIVAPRIGVGAHQRADGDEVPQSRQKAPRIKALAGEHQIVRPAGLSVRRGKRDAVVKPF